MISIIMFDMSTHDFACQQQHYFLVNDIYNSFFEIALS